MATPSRHRRQLRSLLWRASVDEEVDAELAFHLEMRTRELVAAGLDPATARREALRRFGDLRDITRTCRRLGAEREDLMRRTELLDELRQDVRFALRAFAKSPGFTAVVVLALALGIGANAAIFSVVNTVLLRPLPYGEPERVATIWNRWEGWPATWLSVAEYVDLADGATSFEHVAAWASGGRNLTGGDAPERVQVAFATANIFPALGVRPALGRGYTPAEDAPGGPRVAVIADGLWRRRFGADPAIVGGTIVLNDSTVTVLGVMPPGFQLPNHLAEQPMDLWMPIQIDHANPGGRGSHFLYALGRLKPGVTQEQGNAEIESLARRMKERFPQQYSPAFGTFTVPVERQVLGDVRPALLVLSGAVALVLLVACANVASLLLARAETRQREIAVRTALGAGRGRLLRQLLVESLLLALAGGAAGVALAVAGVRALLAAAPESVPRIGSVAVDAPVLLFALAVSLGTGLLFGLVPALHATRDDLGGSLREGGRGATADGARSRLRRGLVVAEIALALVLVVGAGLLIRSFERLRSVVPGFEPRGLLTARLSLPASRYADNARTRAFYRELEGRVRALPGVREVGAARVLPMDGTMGDWSFLIEGRAMEFHGADNAAGDWQVVTPGYFRAMGIPLRAGRALAETDDERAADVVVVNETLARTFWPDGTPVGARIWLGGGTDSTWRTVIAVVGDVRQNGLDEAPRPMLYLPHAQFPRREGNQQRTMSLVVRATADPASLAGLLRAEVRALDPALPVASVRTMDAIVGGWSAERRLNTIVLAALAALALVLAVVGIYGVIAYMVAQRTREMGVRLALGARPADVLALVVRQGAALAAAGIAIGLTAAWGATRSMTSMLYAVSATDPLTFAGVAAILAVTALAASYLPARRATRVDPVVALRSE